MIIAMKCTKDDRFPAHCCLRAAHSCFYFVWCLDSRSGSWKWAQCAPAVASITPPKFSCRCRTVALSSSGLRVAWRCARWDTRPPGWGWGWSATFCFSLVSIFRWKNRWLKSRTNLTWWRDAFGVLRSFAQHPYLKKKPFLCQTG